MHDIQAIKARLPDYLSAIGHEPRFIGEHKLTCCCPLHDDKHPSFNAVLQDDAWVWKCFPCGEGGSIIELHGLRTGLDTKQDFKRIAQELAETFSLPALAAHTAPRALPKPPQPSAPLPFTEAEQTAHYELTTPWRCALNDSAALQERIAASLTLKATTIRACVMPCFDALGIAPAGTLLRAETHYKPEWRTSIPRLACIYEGAFKVRSPVGDDRQPRFAMVGIPRRPWRSFALLRKHLLIKDSRIQICHITEGESDCLALIEAGLEDWQAARPSHCIAIPGADGFQPAWARMFTGIECHLWRDNDKGGETFTENTARALHGYARRIIINNPFHQLQAA